MTVVRITNANVSGLSTPIYIELWATKLDHSMDNDVVNFFLPTAPAEWLTAGVPTNYKRSLFDMKNITESYAVNAELDVDSNRDSSWDPDPLTTVNRVAANMRTLFQTGGTITFYYLDGTDTYQLEGMMTTLKIGEDQQDQGELSPPRILGCQFTFLVGQNFEE